MAWFEPEELVTRMQTDRYLTDALLQARDFAETVITAYLVGYTIADPPEMLLKLVALDVAKRYLEDRIVSETIGTESYRYADPSPQWLSKEEKKLLGPLRGLGGGAFAIDTVPTDVGSWWYV